MPNSCTSNLEPAATVVLLRDGEAGLEVLLLRRHAALANFPGAWVFPGGKVDEADGDGRDDWADAARAAVRETEEETGLRLAAGTLIPWSCWIPPEGLKRRFATRFFLARAPAAKVVPDEAEIEDFLWLPPGEAIARNRVGALHLIAPTYVSLALLERFPRVGDALSDAAAQPVRHYETKLVQKSGIDYWLWAPDAAWPDGDPDAPGPRNRIEARPDGSWRYISDPV